MDFHIAAATDIGTKRKINQDNFFVRKVSTQIGKMVLAVLCDGMGGLAHGEIASGILVHAFSEWMDRRLPALSQKPLEDHVLRKEWSDLVSKQNKIIRLYGIVNKCKIGSTITVLLLTEDRYYLLNIGDTRAYEITKSVTLLTKDHTIIEREIDRGNITRKQAENLPEQHMLTRCVGVMETVCPDIFFGRVKEEAVYMLCTDGFRHCISENEMSSYLYPETKADRIYMEYWEKQLIEINKQRGETDNITVVAIFSFE